MVKASKVEKVLASLLVDDCSNRHKKAWKKFMRTRYRLAQLKRRNPEKFNTLTNKIVADLGEFEKAVNS